MPTATDDVLAAVDRLTVLAHHHDALRDLAVLTGALAAAMPPDCIIGPAEVRQLAGGVTHRTFKLWREGQNLAGRGPFPTPVQGPDCPGRLHGARRRSVERTQLPRTLRRHERHLAQQIRDHAAVPRADRRVMGTTPARRPRQRVTRTQATRRVQSAGREVIPHALYSSV
jgi:hypothetical protein